MYCWAHQGLSRQIERQRERKMVKQNDPMLEMVAGVIGVFTLTAECESFGYEHMIIGGILALYAGRSIGCHKGMYSSLLFSAVLSLLIVLALGKPLDWFRDACFRNSISRDATFSSAWLVLLIVAFIVEFIVQHRSEAAHEAD
jgi:hypothetical protein